MIRIISGKASELTRILSAESLLAMSLYTEQGSTAACKLLQTESCLKISVMVTEKDDGNGAQHNLFLLAAPTLNVELS